MQRISELYFITEYLYKADDGFMSKSSLMIYPSQLQKNSSGTGAEFVSIIQKQTGHTPMSLKVIMFEKHSEFQGTDPDGMECWQIKKRESTVIDFQQDLLNKYFEHQQKRIDQGITPSSDPA